MTPTEDLLRETLDRAAIAFPASETAWADNQRRLAARRRAGAGVAIAAAAAAATVVATSVVSWPRDERPPAASSASPSPTPSPSATAAADPLHGVPRAEADALAGRCAASFERAGREGFAQLPAASEPWRAIFALPGARAGAHTGTVVMARAGESVPIGCLFEPSAPLPIVLDFGRQSWLPTPVFGGVTNHGGGRFDGYGRYVAPVTRVTVTPPGEPEQDAVLGNGVFWVEGVVADSGANPARASWRTRGYDAAGRLVYDEADPKVHRCYLVDGKAFGPGGDPLEPRPGCVEPFYWPS